MEFSHIECVAYSNMLTISFGSRTDSTLDPLVERALSLATEFMNLSGKFPPPHLPINP
jgi:hypothetical protein